MQTEFVIEKKILPLKINTKMNISSERLDLVFIIGKDNPGETTHSQAYKAIKAACDVRHLKYLIIGDGVTDVDIDDIPDLPDTNNISIYAHGDVINGEHVIQLNTNGLTSTATTIKKMQEKANCKNIGIFSCYGGKAIDDIKNDSQYKLQEGTILTAYSAPDESSWSNDVTYILNNLIKKTTSGKISPMISLLRDVIMNIPQTMVIACQLKDELVSETLPRK